MSEWAQDSVFYHIYPLGLLGAERRNDFGKPPIPRLKDLLPWAAHLGDLGVTALYLGPVFESTAHGYDTRDYFSVDRRLGSDRDLVEVVEAFHRRGIRVVLDAVFNHVGRDFPAFQDLRERGRDSRFRSWFAGLDFAARSPMGDSFGYEGWNGCFDLVKLNLGNPEVREHVFSAVGAWIERFGIDGLRLDTADCLDTGFIAGLRELTAGRKKEFLLLGEVVFGDYRRWVNTRMLDSVTNYECYKGLWSSLNDRNFFEIAYSFDRQFGHDGMYRGMALYNFVDNHDVTRAASILGKRAHLYPLYCLLFTMPGIPSLYYGSEFGIPGKKTTGSDDGLRPALKLEKLRSSANEPDLLPALKRLVALRASRSELRRGDYRRVLVRHEQLAFSRSLEGRTLIVAVNASDAEAEICVPAERGWRMLRDVLNGGAVACVDGKAVLKLYPHWARVLEPSRE